MSAGRVPSEGVYGFLLRPKWLLFLGGCVLFAAICVRLGYWQLDRLDQRRALNARVVAARHAEPIAPDAVLRIDRALPRRDEYRQVKAVGRYDTDHEYLVRGRTVDGNPGLYVLTPLITADGKALLVVRGWIPPSSGGADVAPDVPAAPSGEVTAVARVRQPEESSAGEEARVGGRAQIKHIDPAQIGRELNAPTYRAYAELVKQTPAVDKKLVLVPEPELDEGPHLSYAVQWFLFATMTLVGYGVYARREEQRRREPAEAPVSPVRATSTTLAD